jgi:hypothetical protein
VARGCSTHSGRAFCSGLPIARVREIGSYGVLLLHPWVLVGASPMHSPPFS